MMWLQRPGTLIHSLDPQNRAVHGRANDHLGWMNRWTDREKGQTAKKSKNAETLLLKLVQGDDFAARRTEQFVLLH